ncbi:MAG: hypothetical protein KC590_11020 [Nitrospira sp.]|nr:hypothetical protein [Nitrospira sp.]
MDHRCLPTKRHFLEPPGVGAGLRLSSGQIGLLRKLARDSRTGFMVPLHQRKQGLPQKKKVGGVFRSQGFGETDGGGYCVS